MKKKLLIVLSMIIFALCCIFSVSADEPTLSLKCGDDILCTFDEKTETIYVEGNGKMVDCNVLECAVEGTDSKPENPYVIQSKYKKIVISDGITHIGDKAFEGFIGVEEIEIGKDVKSIGEKAFYFTLGEAHIKNITVPETVLTIGEYALGYAFDEYNDYAENGFVDYRIKDFVLIGDVDSAAYEYCEKYAVTFGDIDGCKQDEHKWGKKQTVSEKVCGESVGVYCEQCRKCGSRQYEYGEELYHNFLAGSEKTLKEATYFKRGKEKAYCLDCDKYITYKTEKLKVEEAEYKVKRGKNQVSFTFTNDEENVSYYKVTAYTYNKKGRKDLKSYTVEDKKLTVKGLKKNKKYYFDIESCYKQEKKTAKTLKIVTVKTKK